MVPLGAFHAALDDTSNISFFSFIMFKSWLSLRIEFRGYEIPKGTIIFANLYKVHHNPEYWEKPDEFYPEHFLDKDGSVKTPEAFIPFGIGNNVFL